MIADNGPQGMDRQTWKLKYNLYHWVDTLFEKKRTFSKFSFSVKGTEN